MRDPGHGASRIRQRPVGQRESGAQQHLYLSLSIYLSTRNLSVWIPCFFLPLDCQVSPARRRAIERHCPSPCCSS